MFRRAASEHGLTLNVLSQRSPIALSTLRGWSYGAAMPAWSIGCLAEAGIPDDLLSLLLEPFARHVGSDGNTEVMFDHAAADAMAFATQASAARSPDSPGGTTIVPQEAGVLRKLACKLAASARRASRG